MSERAEFRNSDSPDHSAGHQPILKDDDDNSSTSDLDSSMDRKIKSDPNYSDTSSEGMDHDSGNGVTDPSKAAATNPTAPPADTLVDGVLEPSSAAATNPTAPPADPSVDGVTEPSSASAAPNADMMNSDPSPEVGDKDGKSEAGATSSIKQQVTATSPLMENVKQLAAQMKTQNGEQVDTNPAKDIYHLKWVKFKGRRVPIVTQNINGPCPLLAIVNVLLLNEKITLDSSADVVTSSQLMGYLGDIVLQAMPDNLEQGERANWEQNVNDAIAVFHKLQTGLDVNVRFTGVQDFEYTPECVVFDLLSICLYHGWVVDTALADTVNAVGNLTYNQLVEMIIENQSSTDTDKSTRAVLGQLFLDESASQLTYHGLAELSCTLVEDKMAVFFRNNHFSTIYKYRGELFLLVTDQGYLREGQVVWETMSNVEGDGYLVDAEFHTAHRLNREPLPPPAVPVNTDQQMEQDMLLAMALNQQQEVVVDKAFKSESDAQFALRLHEEEKKRAAALQQQQQQHNPTQLQPQQPYPQQPHQPRPQQPHRQQPRAQNSGYEHHAQHTRRERKDSGISCTIL